MLGLASLGCVRFGSGQATLLPTGPDTGYEDSAGDFGFFEVDDTADSADSGTLDTAITPPDPCFPTASGIDGGPVLDPKGPYFHHVGFSHYVDGSEVVDPVRILDHASVPDGVLRADGAARMYYINGNDGFLWVGALFEDLVIPIAPVQIDGFIRIPGAFDPDAILLPDGKIRLYYLLGAQASNATPNPRVCVADAEDGESFTALGTAIELPDYPDTYSDPSVLRLEDGRFAMALSHGKSTVLGESDDGLHFTLNGLEIKSIGGVPELAQGEFGRQLFVCPTGGDIDGYRSDDGVSWHPLGTYVTAGTLGAITCDPSRVAGTDWFLFKYANP